MQKHGKCIYLNTFYKHVRLLPNARSMPLKNEYQKLLAVAKQLVN